MITPLLVVTGMEEPSTETEYGEHKDNLKDDKKKKEPKSYLKTKTKMKECNDRKILEHFPYRCLLHVEAKVDIKAYAGEFDAIKLKQWLQQMELYFSEHEVTKNRGLHFLD